MVHRRASVVVVVADDDVNKKKRIKTPPDADPQTRLTGAGLLTGKKKLARTRARHARARQPLRVTIPASITT